MPEEIHHAWTFGLVFQWWPSDELLPISVPFQLSCCLYILPFVLHPDTDATTEHKEEEKEVQEIFSRVAVCKKEQ
jgi:hypothetical protein